MADCITQLITQNIVDTLNGKYFTIGSIDYRSVCEQERSVYDTGGEDVYIQIIGPWGEVVERAASNSLHVKLNYFAAMHINMINDTGSNDPITKQCANIGADIAALIMEDITQGGYAINTNIEAPPAYLFDDSETSPEFIVYVQFAVMAMIDETNFYNNSVA